MMHLNKKSQGAEITVTDNPNNTRTISCQYQHVF